MTSVPHKPAILEPQQRDYWLFSAPIDLAAFLGSALVALLLLAVGSRLGLLHVETPEWAWVPAILLIDVAHVYATGFRVYFDREELARRWVLYTLIPLGSLLAGAALYNYESLLAPLFGDTVKNVPGPGGELLFWRVLAYLAVFHFIRQQYGWVRLYRAKLGEHGKWSQRIDTVAIYMATVYPLIYWHAHLPRRFWWFLDADFHSIPILIADIARPVYWLALGAYAVKSIHCWSHDRPNPGKDIVVATTAVCWYAGIVTFNSDYAFTVTNVIIHGVPYIALIYWYMRSRETAETAKPARRRRTAWQTCVILLSTVWVLAFVEELVWDRAVWQEHGWLFGPSIDLGRFELLLVPLLAVPQITHYLLDGFIWRRKSNPNFSLIRRDGDAARTS